MPLDFAQYKPRIGDFLRARGIDFSTGNFRCFAHDDGHTPSKWSMHLYGERVICYGCGFNGDIYDVVGVFDGIDDSAEQFKAVESFFNGSHAAVGESYKMDSTPSERFNPYPDAINAVRDYMVSIRGQYREELAVFARHRGFPDDYGYKLVWWPGLDIAGPALGRDTLESAGIVEPGKDRGAWSSAGVALKVGLGFKLHYIGQEEDGKRPTIKRESRGGHTFPFPALPDSDTLVLVEGELDAVSMRYAGIDSVSIGGLNGLSLSDAASIQDRGFDCVCLCLDNDLPGRTALGFEPPKYKRYKTIPAILREGGYTGEIRYIDWSQNEDSNGEKDADDLVKHDKVYVLKHLIENAVLWEVCVEDKKEGCDNSVRNAIGRGLRSSTQLDLSREDKDGENHAERDEQINDATIESVPGNESEHGQPGRGKTRNDDDGERIESIPDSTAPTITNEHNIIPEETAGSGERGGGLDGQAGGPSIEDIRIEETIGSAGDGVNDRSDGSESLTVGHQSNDSGTESDNRWMEVGDERKRGDNGGTFNVGNDIGNESRTSWELRSVDSIREERDRVHGNDNGHSREGESGKGVPSDLIPRESIPFQFLGFDKEAYYVLPKRQNIALKISRGDKAIKDKLNEIAHPDWWFTYFQATGREGNEYTDYASAVDWFRRQQIAKGMYDDDLLLGTGGHYDEGKVIVNTGKGVCTPSGEWSTYEAYTGHNTYCRSPHELVIGDKPWTVEESQYFLDQLHTFSFDSPFSYYAISGFCALAPFASMLRRRPHIWITGQKGEGKSVLLRDVIYPVIGEGYSVYKEGLTTEAAFRQNLKRDNRPIINDEFEINRREDQSTIDGVLTLSRIAYSGESVSKGTSNQQGVSFTTKIMFCFASINVNIRNDADRSRIVVCRMKESRGRMRSIKNVDGLRGRMFLRLDTLNHNIELAHDMIENEGHDSRTADTHAPFLAAHWMMTNDTQFGVDNDRTIGEMKEALSTIGASDERTTDEDRILVRIFQEKVHLSPDTEFTIAEMLTKKDDLQNPLFDNELQRLGVRRKTGTEKEGCGGIEILCIVSKHDAISKMLSETPFTNYKEVLKRNTAYIGSRPVHIGGQSQSALIFRWDMISMKYFEEAREELPF